MRLGPQAITIIYIASFVLLYIILRRLQNYIDSYENIYSFERYINDCCNMDAYNVTFLKSPSECCAWVISCKSIQIGEELFVDYGNWYWIKKNPTKLSSSLIAKRKANV